MQKRLLDHGFALPSATCAMLFKAKRLSFERQEINTTKLPALKRICGDLQKPIMRPLARNDPDDCVNSVQPQSELLLCCVSTRNMEPAKKRSRDDLIDGSEENWSHCGGCEDGDLVGHPHAAKPRDQGLLVGSADRGFTV